MKNDFSFEIVEHIGVFREESKGWRGEVNRVSWNGNPPKIDIRSWNEDHTKMAKVATYTEEEARLLAQILYRV